MYGTPANIMIERTVIPAEIFAGRRTPTAQLREFTVNGRRTRRRTVFVGISPNSCKVCQRHRQPFAVCGSLKSNSCTILYPVGLNIQLAVNCGSNVRAKLVLFTSQTAVLNTKRIDLATFIKMQSAGFNFVIPASINLQ